MEFPRVVWWKQQRLKAIPIPIVANGIVATKHVADGQMIPVLIIDCSNRPDIAHLIAVHKHLPPGDVRSQWALPASVDETVALHLRFLRPVITNLLLVFPIIPMGGLVDLIIRSRLVYLQPGRSGDQLSTNLDTPKILVEIPSTEFAAKWEKLYRAVTRRELKARGLARSKLAQGVDLAIEELRRLTDRRI